MKVCTEAFRVGIGSYRRRLGGMKQPTQSLKITPAIWSLCDQAVVSVGNFLTQLLLARHLSRSDYGIFALLFGTIFFLMSSLGTIVTYPLSIRGAAVDAHGLRQLIGASLCLCAALLFPEAVIVLGTAILLQSPGLFPVALGALMFWQCQETLRRGLMAHLSHKEAIYGDVVNYIGQTLLVLLLVRTNSLTLQSSFIAIASTSAAAAAIQFAQIKPVMGALKELRSLAIEYWHLGSWVCSTNFVNGGTQQIFPWALGLIFGASAVGSFQAATNPARVFNPVVAGIQNLITPAVAEMQGKQGTRSAAKSGLAYAIVGASLCVPGFFGIFFWPKAILQLLYGPHSPYLNLTIALRICALAWAFGYCAEVVNSLLSALGRPSAGFIAQAAATCTAIFIGVPLIFRLGLVGAFVSMTLCAVVKAGVGFYRLRPAFVAKNHKVRFPWSGPKI